MKLTGFLFTVLCAAVLGCHSGPARNNILPVNTMKLVLWDIMKADEWYALTSIKDSAHLRYKENIQLYEQVFAIHGTNRAQFYKSYQYYESHPEQFKVLIDSVTAVATREKALPKSGPKNIKAE